MKILSVVLLGLFLSTNARAQVVETILEPVELVAGTVRGRNQHNSAGDLTRNQLQYIFDLRLRFNLTKDGKLKLAGRILTGPKFDTDANDLGVGNHTEFKNDINLRTLYVEYQPNDQIQFQAGAIPSLPSVKGASQILSLDNDGWVDGGRAVIKTKTAWMDQVAVTVGRMDHYQQPSAIVRLTSREMEPNFLQVHVRGNLSKLVGFVTEVTQLEDETYLRGVLELAVKDVVKFVDTVAIEELIRVDRGTHEGFAVSLRKKIQKFNVIGTYSFKDKGITSAANGTLQLQDTFTRGHQFGLVVERPIGKKGVLFARVFKNTSQPTNSLLPHNDFISKSGLRAEVNYRITWDRRKKK